MLTVLKLCLCSGTETAGQARRSWCTRKTNTLNIMVLGIHFGWKICGRRKIERKWSIFSSALVVKGECHWRYESSIIDVSQRIWQNDAKLWNHVRGPLYALTMDHWNGKNSIQLLELGSFSPFLSSFLSSPPLFLKEKKKTPIRFLKDICN